MTLDHFLDQAIKILTLIGVIVTSVGTILIKLKQSRNSTNIETIGAEQARASTRIETIAAEFKPNGGTSLKDHLTKQDTQASRIEEKVEAAAVAAKLAAQAAVIAAGTAPKE